MKLHKYYAKISMNGFIKYNLSTRQNSEQFDSIQNLKTCILS